MRSVKAYRAGRRRHRGNFGRRIYCAIDGVEGRGEGCIDVGVEEVWMLIVLGNFRLGED